MEEAAGNARVNSESVEQRLREAERRLEDNVAAAKRSVYHAASLGLEEAERAKRSLRAALADARSRSESLRQCFKEQGAPSPPRSAAGRAAPDGRGEAGQAEPRTAQAWSARGVEELLCAPDLAAEGWVCLQGPHGQQCWHHRSLGPAPWEAPLAAGGSLRESGVALGDFAPRPEEPAPSAPERTRSMSVDLPPGGGAARDAGGALPPRPRAEAQRRRGRLLSACA